jgi:hypothetical protein
VFYSELADFSVCTKLSIRQFRTMALVAFSDALPVIATVDSCWLGTRQSDLDLQKN